MRNKIAVVLGSALMHSETAAKGLHRWEAALGINNNKEAAVRADQQKTRQASSEYQAAKSARPLATAAFRVADAKVVTFITVTRELLKPKFGSRYSVAWNAVGFYNRTLRVPRVPSRRLTLLAAMRSFLVEHPELVVPGVMSPEIAQAVHDEMTVATTGINVAKAVQRQHKVKRDEAAKALRTRLQNLFHELKQFLPANDPRWLEFGFNIPEAVTVPAAPEDLKVIPILPGHVSASWKRPVGADRFRLFCLVVGQDTEFVPLASSRESEVNLSGLTSGARVRLYVTAVNAAGESLPSEIVEVVVT